MTAATTPWANILDFWFPEGCSLDVEAEPHRDHWSWRLHGGADTVIVERFADLTRGAASGELDDWAVDPEGRLALIVVLDQFSRSLWRGTPRAFAQDPAALSLAIVGLSNGHYESLKTPWFRIVYSQPFGHCEGADHLQRIDLLISLREEIALQVPVPLQAIYRSLVKQAGDVRKIIAAFGRHPHRNQVLGRQSAPEEESYIAAGDFPHQRAFQG